jgi:hypothetical protein
METKVDMSDPRTAEYVTGSHFEISGFMETFFSDGKVLGCLYHSRIPEGREPGKEIEQTLAAPLELHYNNHFRTVKAGTRVKNRVDPICGRMKVNPFHR